MQNFYSNKTSFVNSDDNYRKGLDDVLAGLKAAMLEAKKDGTCRDKDTLVTQEKDYQIEHQPEPQQEVQQNTNDVQMVETVSKLCPQPIPQPTLNGFQTVSKRYTKPTPNGFQTVSQNHETASKRIENSFQTVTNFHNFSDLSTAQRNLLKVLYGNAKINGNRTTQRLSLSYIAEIAHTSAKAVKSTIWKLKCKGLLTTKEYRDGRGGWVIYEIPEVVFLDILNHENGFQTTTKQYPQPIPQPTPEPLYNNNTNSINTIITTSANQTTLPTEWQAVDITPLADIGLSKKHIAALYEANNISANVVQESINHYAWGLKNNPEPYKKYKNHLCGLMGVLKKGHAWIESGYESEIDVLAKEMESRERQQNERREKQLNELVDLMFPDWESELTPEQKKKITPSPGGGIRLDSEVVRMLLKNYFKKEVLLPRLRKEAQLQASRL